jgi:hypothetical protein
MRPLAAAAGMGMGAYITYAAAEVMFRTNAVSVIIAIFAGFLLYLFFMTLINGFSPDDLRMFRRNKLN